MSLCHIRKGLHRALYAALVALVVLSLAPQAVLSQSAGVPRPGGTERPPSQPADQPAQIASVGDQSQQDDEPAEETGEPLGTGLTSQLRFGVAANRNPLDYAGYVDLDMGWYHNWSARPTGGAIVPDVQFYPTVGAWGDLWGNETEVKLRYFVEQAPDTYCDGTIWFIGNELDLDTFSTIGGEPLSPSRPITPQEYAQKYKKYYDIIKGINPSYRVGMGSLIRGWSFLYDTRAEYQRLYGTKMPIDVYSMHAYMDTSNVDILNQVKLRVNSLRPIMKEFGDQDKWLVITETGALYDAGDEVINGFMNDAFDYLSTATSAEYGCASDDYHMVQRWAWFALTSWDPINTHRWQGTDLFDIDATTITPVGQNYADYPKAPPALPSAFWGKAQVDGENVSDGTVVTAWIDGTQVAQTVASHYDGYSRYSLYVEEDDAYTPERDGGNDSETIRFKIGSQWVAQTATWQSGGVVEKDINGASPSFGAAEAWINAYGPNSGGWASQNAFPRTLADVDGDGHADIVGFGGRAVFVSLGSASGFGPMQSWIGGYGPDAGGWIDQNTYPRTLGDVNGDGKDDIVGFGSKAVYVSLSNGSGFGPQQEWIDCYGTKAGGWVNQATYPRMIGDVNGDGMDDIVGFGSRATYVSLSTGSSFGPLQTWIEAYGPRAGDWISQDTYPRALGDVNGDGRADIVGFGSRATYVSLSTGSSFGPLQVWINQYGTIAGGWASQDVFPRTLGDVNGDGKADIVGFGNREVYVSLSNGASFEPLQAWLKAYGPSSGGWVSQNAFPRTLGDVTGDGNADVVGFGGRSTFVSVASGQP